MAKSSSIVPLQGQETWIPVFLTDAELVLLFTKAVSQPEPNHAYVVFRQNCLLVAVDTDNDGSIKDSAFVVQWLHATLESHGIQPLTDCDYWTGKNPNAAWEDALIQCRVLFA